MTSTCNFVEIRQNMSMNRLFTLLIISLLFSQSALAFYEAEINCLQDQVYTQTSDQNEVHGDYDHCGHACAHLIGLVASNSLNIFITPKGNLFTVQTSATPITYQPPVPPPTA
jgi:hypothetical protein